MVPSSLTILLGAGRDVAAPLALHSPLLTVPSPVGLAPRSPTLTRVAGPQFVMPIGAALYL